MLWLCSGNRSGNLLGLQYTAKKATKPKPERVLKWLQHKPLLVLLNLKSGHYFPYANGKELKLQRETSLKEALGWPWQRGRWWLQTTLWSSSSGSIFEFKDSHNSKTACRRLEASHPPLSACLFTVPTKRHDIYVSSLYRIPPQQYLALNYCKQQISQENVVR